MLSQNNNSPVKDTVGDSIALQKLIVSAKKGDTQAFGEVYTTLYRPLYRYTFSRCRDKELAEDICQQTFLKFYEALASYTHEKSVLAYLYTIAKRLLINHQEKKTFSSFDETLLETLGEEPTIEQEVDIKRMADEVNDYLTELTQDEQEVIRLYFYAELSYREISEVLDREEAYLRKIKERALKKLRILTRHFYEQP